MYQYNEFDRAFLQSRAAQFRDQLQRWQAGTLADDAFKPLRLQNGWYVQRFAPMLRVAVPYGEINSAQLRVLAKVAREYDHKEAHDTSKANAGLSEVPTLPDRTAHFTTPYLTGGPGGETDWKGEPTFPVETINKMVKSVYDAKLALIIHCNGDAAIDNFLTAHELAIGDAKAGDHRTGIIHWLQTRRAARRLTFGAAE